MLQARIVRAAAAVAVFSLALAAIVAAPLAAPAGVAGVMAGMYGHVSMGDLRRAATEGEVRISLLPEDPVDLATYSTFTDADGFYSLGDVPEGYYDLVTHDTLGRYPDVVDRILLTFYTKRDFSFGAVGSIEGTMRSAAGLPLAGQVILHVRYADGVRGDLFRHGVGPNGGFFLSSLPLEDAERWTLEFLPDDAAYAPQYWQSRSMHQAPTILLADDFLADVQYDAALPLAASISGTIGGDVSPADFAGERVDVEVMVLDDAGTTWIGSGDHYTVRPDGTYEVPRMSPGSYRLRLVWGFGGGVTRVDSPVIDLDPAEDTTFDFAPATPTFTRDLSGDGLPDLLARNSAGQLLSYPVTAEVRFGPRRTIGTGWGSMTALVRAGDFSGDGRDDVIARDAYGYLWLYRGTATGGLSTKVKIGTGWKTYTALFCPGDFNGDGTSDLIARDAGGSLFLYPGNGVGRFLSRVKIGTGWGGFTALLSPGDYDSDGANDIVVRDAGGTIWLYPGNGTGGVTPRVKLATGWNGYTAILSIGDFDGDRLPDLIGRDSIGWLWLIRHVDLSTGLTPTFKSLIGTGWKYYTFVR